jgi:hypothetical protein
MMSATTQTRRVQIETLSAQAELLLVVRVAMTIAIGVSIYLGAQPATFGRGAAGTNNLLPFQRLIADQSPEEQRIFRELQEGLLEAETARSTSGSWPQVQSLAAGGVPPFATDPTQRESYRWQLLQRGAIVNYLGIPAGANAPAWLVMVQEPEPGAPPDPAGEDEEHHRLGNGTMLHVSIWVHPEGRKIAASVVRVPQIEAWIQLYAVSPSLGPVRK